MTGAADQPGADRRTWVEQIMGLPVSVLARGPGALEPWAADAVTALYDDLRKVDATFSPYLQDSEVSRIARGELALADACEDVRAVARRCDEAHAWTGGLFDASGPSGWDPSGLVKGWAVARAAATLLAQAPGSVDWCVNAGGDVVVAAPSGQPFTVGIQDPRDVQSVVAAVALTAGAVATSGTAARGAHLYDPRTGEPVASRWLSVSVTGPDLERADVLATAAFVAADGWAELVTGFDGYEALAVAADGHLEATRGWPRS